MLATSHRLNTLLLLLMLIVGVAIVAMLATGARGGPLDPASGPVSTDGVREPGTPIASIPITITQPGYYYLTHNLVAAADGQDGISVVSDDVTLDLKGFTLKGSNKTGIGVSTTSPARSLTVRNGVIERWGTAVEGSQAAYAHYTDIRIIGNQNGIFAFLSTVEDCSISENIAGIFASLSTVRGCQLSFNSTNAIFVTDSSVIAENRFESNSLGSPSFADIDVSGNDNVIKDNTTHTAPGHAWRVHDTVTPAGSA